jgi:hypothetical protein
VAGRCDHAAAAKHQLRPGRLLTVRVACDIPGKLPTQGVDVGDFGLIGYVSETIVGALDAEPAAPARAELADAVREGSAR